MGAQDRRCNPTSNLEVLVDADLDTLAIELYVRADDLLKAAPERAPWRPATGIGPQVSDAELVTLAVMQALLGFTSEARWLRHARRHLTSLFPYLPRQSRYNQRLRTLAATIPWLIPALAPRPLPPALGARTGALRTEPSRRAEDVGVIASPPVERGGPRETVKRSDLAGWAEYGYCASHARYFRGLRLHLLCTLHGRPAGFALTGAKADERQVLLHILDDRVLTVGRAWQIILADKNHYGAGFEITLADGGICLLRPARHRQPP